MPTPSMKAGSWPTKIQVQCRQEPPFYARIMFHQVPKRGLVPVINCPHCARGYFLNEEGEWVSDRPLVILEDKE